MTATERIYRHGLVQALLRVRRRRRVGWLLRHLRVREPLRVLDVGCGVDGRSLADHVPPTWDVVGVDLHEPADVTVGHPRFAYIQQDARDLSRFEDHAFDVAFSIGMLEHVCDPADLRRVAQEMQRVARQVAVVVPWRGAWLEPHFKFPFFPLLPLRIQNALATGLDLHGRAKYVRADPSYIPAHYQWLPRRAWRHLFPRARVLILPTLETIGIVGPSARSGS